METELLILSGTAVSIGFIHTIFGPDHYLPFIVLSKARGWSIAKTGLITLLCGIGHVASSIILGFIGLIFGIAVFKLEKIESFRGEAAAWLLIILGFTYFVWGIHRAIRNKHHRHIFNYGHSVSHSLNQSMGETSVSKANENTTFWLLFIIFVLGPCEPLIPLIMYPAAKGNMHNVAVVALIFGITTIVTMLGIVLIGSLGLSRIPMRHTERYSHALAGFTIFLCGISIKFLGL